MSRVLIAPDKFKGSLSARQVADHLRRALLAAAPGLAVTAFEIADGGEGTVEAAVAAGFQRRDVRVHGPLGDPVTAAFALRDGLALVELAEASGLRRLPAGVPDALRCGTRGTGELIAAALDAGARTVVLAVGGSASTDGGAGMLAALGARFLDADGRELPGGGAALRDLARADLSGLDPRLAATEFLLAADVRNPLLGPNGAAAVYGPQKGANPADVAVLDAGLARLAAVLDPAAADAPGAGAAGGTGYAALTVLGASFRSGIEFLMDLLGFHKALADADLVITGEGSLDEQSLQGKAPLGVAAAARARGLPVIAVCGRLAVDPARLRAAGITAVHSLTDLEPDPVRSMADAGELLERVGETIGRALV
nr:glycerate kinase [Actinomadura atramentaria]